MQGALLHEPVRRTICCSISLSLLTAAVLIPAHFLTAEVDPVPVVVSWPEAALDSPEALATFGETQIAGGMNARKLQVWEEIVGGIVLVGLISGGALWGWQTIYEDSVRPPTVPTMNTQHVPFFFDRPGIASWSQTLSVDDGKDIFRLTVEPTTKKGDANCPSPCGDDIVKVGLRSKTPMKFKALERFALEVEDGELVAKPGATVLITIEKGNTEVTWYYLHVDELRKFSSSSDIYLPTHMYGLTTEGSLLGQAHVAKYRITNFHVARPDSQYLFEWEYDATSATAATEVTDGTYDKVTTAAGMFRAAATVGRR